MFETQTKSTLIFLGCLMVGILLGNIIPTNLKKNLLFAETSSVWLAQESNCLNPQTTRQMNVCSEQELKMADDKLNLLYQQVTKQISYQQKQRLTKAQLAWINFRDQACEYEKGQFEGGSLATSTYNYCLARITRQRITDLENYLEQANL
jgi:uncharacterized protein YecT (DUF1311 family)